MKKTGIFVIPMDIIPYLRAIRHSGNSQTDKLKRYGHQARRAISKCVRLEENPIIRITQRKR